MVKKIDKTKESRKTKKAGEAKKIKRTGRTWRTGRIEKIKSPKSVKKVRRGRKNVKTAADTEAKIREIARVNREIAELKGMGRGDWVVRKERELGRLMSKLDEEDRAVYKKAQGETKVYFWVSIVCLALYFIPVIPMVGSILAVVKANKNRKYSVDEKKNKVTRILGAVGIVMSLVGFYVLYIYNPNRTFTVDGEEVTLVCEEGACSDLEKYVDDDVLRLLAEIGVRKIDNARRNVIDKTINVTAYDSAGARTAVEIVLSYADGGDEVEITKIANKEMAEVVYYSSEAGVETVKFPALDKVRELRVAEAARKAEEEAAAEAARKAEEEAKAAEAARYPSEESTRELCQKAFKRMYPYNGSTVHWVLGERAMGRSGWNQMVYKVDVTVGNMFGATYDAVMECVVSREEGSDWIKVESLTLY